LEETDEYPSSEDNNSTAATESESKSEDEDEVRTPRGTGVTQFFDVSTPRLHDLAREECRILRRQVALKGAQVHDLEIELQKTRDRAAAAEEERLMHLKVIASLAGQDLVTLHHKDARFLRRDPEQVPESSEASPQARTSVSSDQRG